MKVCILVLIAFAVAVGLCQAHSPLTHMATGLSRLRPVEFEEFATRFQRTYATEEEKAHRLAVFTQNLVRSEMLNRNAEEPIFGVTKFMDLTQEEFAARYLNAKLKTLANGTPKQYTEVNVEGMPDSWDWRKLGAVTPVKDQGQCGSCWAFSSTGSMEGAHFLATKTLESFSEQQLVDCVTADSGCDGGLMNDAFEYVIKEGGIELESSYKYTAEDGKCTANKKKLVGKFSSIMNVHPHNETALAAALILKGPISIALNADRMQLYNGGIDKPSKADCDPSQLDHGVLVVGYGEESGTPYWIIKNSWGEDWGEKGYYRVIRGKDACGLATEPSVPEV